MLKAFFNKLLLGLVLLFSVTSVIADVAPASATQSVDAKADKPYYIKPYPKSAWPNKPESWHAWAQQLWQVLNLSLETEKKDQKATEYMETIKSKWDQNSQYKPLQLAFLRGRGIVSKNVKDGMAIDDAIKGAIETVLAGMAS
jgi:hypothetical protein